ncbi:MAG: hypothetical protein ACREDC_11370 [Bradyrhizobium sp.]
MRRLIAAVALLALAGCAPTCTLGTPDCYHTLTGDRYQPYRSQPKIIPRWEVIVCPVCSLGLAATGWKYPADPWRAGDRPIKGQ